MGHAGDAASAAALCLIGGLELALDIAGLGQGVDTLLLGDQILDIHPVSYTHLGIPHRENGRRDEPC